MPSQALIVELMFRLFAPAAFACCWLSSLCARLCARGCISGAISADCSTVQSVRFECLHGAASVELTICVLPDTVYRYTTCMCHLNYTQLCMVKALDFPCTLISFTCMVVNHTQLNHAYVGGNDMPIVCHPRTSAFISMPLILEV